jgi:hypothetical protein
MSQVRCPSPCLGRPPFPPSSLAGILETRHPKRCDGRHGGNNDGEGTRTPAPSWLRCSHAGMLVGMSRDGKGRRWSNGRTEERVGTALWVSISFPAHAATAPSPPAPIAARLPSQASSCALRERPALPVRALARLSLTATPKRLAHYARYWSPHVLSGAAPLPRCGDEGALAHTQDGYADTHAPVCAAVSLGVDLASQRTCARPCAQRLLARSAARARLARPVEFTPATGRLRHCLRRATT